MAEVDAVRCIMKGVCAHSCLIYVKNEVIFAEKWGKSIAPFLKSH